MKKLSLYSKNNIERNHLLNTLKGSNNINLWIFVICMLVYIAGVFWDFELTVGLSTPFDFLPTGLANQYSWHLTDSSMYILSAFRREPFLTLCIGFIIGTMQFGFVFNKRNTTAELSTGVSRKRIYLNKTLYPLLIALTVFTIVKLVVLIINLSIVGYAPILTPAFIANLMQTLLGAVIGYTVAVAGAMFTSRIVEFVFFSAGASLLPTFLFELINSVLGCTLKGYDAEGSSYADGTNEIMYYFRFLDPTLGCNSFFNSFSEFWCNEPFDTAYMIIIADIIWLSVFATIIGLLGRYFEKRYKPEDCRKKAKSNIGIVIPCITVSLIVCVLSLTTFAYYNAQIKLLNGVYEEFGISLLFALVLSVVISTIVTLKPKKAIWGAISTGICTLTLIIISMVGFTGGFGFENAIPDADDIENISMSTPTQLLTAKNNEYFYPFSTQVDYINLDSERDITILRDIHQSFIKDTKGGTGAYCEIDYQLKNGRNITRKYYYIGEDGVDAALKLWETDYIRNQYAFLLEEDKTKINNGEISYTVFESAVTFKNVHIISKYNNITCLDGIITEKELDSLRIALYKDISSMSARDWFYPEHQYGALAVSNVGGTDGIMDKNAPIDEFEGNENGKYYFIINSKMTNTVTLLKKYGLMKYFDLTKEVSSAHLVDANDMVEWYRNFIEYNFDTQKPDGSQIHMTHITWNNVVFDAYAKCCISDIDSFDIFTQVYTDDSGTTTKNSEIVKPVIKISDHTEVPPNEAAELIENAYFSYNAGNDCKFLVTLYTDGTYNTVIIPDK